MNILIWLFFFLLRCAFDDAANAAATILRRLDNAAERTIGTSDALLPGKAVYVVPEAALLSFVWFPMDTISY